MASRRSVLIGSTMVCFCIATAGLAWGAGPSRDVVPAAVQPAPNKLLQAPAISLNKTVGLVPGVCAATDSVTVSTGTQVYYCFVATNTGNVTFNYHSLVDDHLGVILNNFNQALAPGASGPEVIVPSFASGPVMNTGTWTAADVVGGYSVDDTITFDFEDISTTGTAIVLSDDSIEQFPIGFTFDYYGSVYTNFYVSSNGFLADNGDNNGCCTGQPLPDTGAPNGVIAGWWEDLNPSAGGTVHYQLMGSAPNRYVIVQYTAVQHYGGGNPVTLQYKLFETSGVIEVHYQAAPSDGGTHSAGIENQDGTIGLQYYLGTAALGTPLAVRYTPAPTLEAIGHRHRHGQHLRPDHRRQPGEPGEHPNAKHDRPTHPHHRQHRNRRPGVGSRGGPADRDPGQRRQLSAWNGRAVYGQSAGQDGARRISCSRPDSAASSR